MGSQEMSTSTFSFSQRTSEACTLPQKTMVAMSLYQHLQQDDAEEAAVQSFIMHRFLPAAKEVAAEHESFVACLASKEAPLFRRSQRTPIARRTKLRAPPKGFTPSRPLHSQDQEDNIPDSMRSCGFFCEGVKTALFCAHRTVSASGRSTLRKKSWAPHPSNHLKVADKGTSIRSSEMEGPVERKKEAMGGVTKHQSGINVDVPILHPLRSPNSANGQESPRRHAIKYHTSFSRRGCPSSDGCTILGPCNPPLSQSGKVNLAGNLFENMKSTQSPHDDHVSARNFASTALKEQDNETVQEGVALCNQKRTCDCESTCVCDHVKNLPPHDPAGENMSRSTLGRSETNGGKPAHDYSFSSAWKDGDDDEDDEPQFFDALSRHTFDSPRSECEVLGFEGEWVNDELDFSDASSHFYTFVSPRSESKVLGFEGEWVNDELDFTHASSHFYTFDSPRFESKVLGFEDGWVNDELDFTDASSHFETPRASTSENKSLISHVCAANEKVMSGKMSSLNQRVGKGPKLETERKQAISPSKHDPCGCEQKHEPQQAELQTRRFSRLRHRSLDSLSGLYLSEASAIFPVFPAKCQKNTLNAPGWPFGISSYQSSKVGGSPHHIDQQEKIVEKYVEGGNVLCPPLPPSPTEPWLGKAITKNASKPSPLATLQHKEKVASVRTKSMDFTSVNPDAERRWEDVVKGSRVHQGHLRYSEELEIVMLTSL